MRMCTKCGSNPVSPGAEPLCGTCWSQDGFAGGQSSMKWPSYADTFKAMLGSTGVITGRRCRICDRKLVAVREQDMEATLCADCERLGYIP